MLPVGILKSAMHQLMALFIEDEKYFTEQLEEMNPILLIKEIVALTPYDWSVTKKENRKSLLLPKPPQKYSFKAHADVYPKRIPTTT